MPTLFWTYKPEGMKEKIVVKRKRTLNERVRRLEKQSLEFFIMGMVLDILVIILVIITWWGDK